MKLFVVLSFMALVSAAPQAQQRPNPSEPEVQILRFESDNDGLGTYRYALEQSDGTKKEEQGELRNPGAENESIAVKGSYSWVDPNGVTYTITYIADENGFQPTIEQGPGGGIPPAVVASLLG